MKRLSRLKEILWLISMLGLVAIFARLVGGLGDATNLSDAMPWGLWKILNMVAGVALATGGFVLAAIVYVFRIEKHRPVLKPAILVAMLGYGSSCFALFLDIGLPHRIWHPLFFWNHHSFLFEVAWCVMLYFSVTMLETAPVVLERFNFHKMISILHKATIPIVILGITLSTLHHTSLGSLFLVMPARMHSLWFTSGLPLLFFISAVGAGIQTVIFVCLAYSYFFNKRDNMPMLTGLAKVSAVVLGLFLIAKIADLAWRGNLNALFTMEYESVFFLLELLLGAIVPIILIAIPTVRNKPGGLAAAAGIAIAGLLLNRMNVGIVGLLRSADVGYFPSLVEICLSLGIIAAAALVFIFMVENFNVFEPAQDKAPVMPCTLGLLGANPPWSRALILSHERITLIAVFAIPIAFGLLGMNGLHGLPLIKTPVSAPKGIDETRSILEINGNENNDFVHFKHEFHQIQLGKEYSKEQSCRLCHHLDLPGDKASACYQCHQDMFQSVSIFQHTLHQEKLGGNWSCQECHDSALPKNAANAKLCFECHQEDMGMNAEMNKNPLGHALAYVDAMHQQCIECHRSVASEIGKPEMTDCTFCHGEAWQAMDATVLLPGVKEMKYIDNQKRRIEKCPY